MGWANAFQAVWVTGLAPLGVRVRVEPLVTAQDAGTLAGGTSKALEVRLVVGTRSARVEGVVVAVEAVGVAADAGPRKEVLDEPGWAVIDAGPRAGGEEK